MKDAKGFIPEAVIDEIRRRADIVEIISEHVPLKKMGRNHRGLCPFHTDSHPSFNVNPELGMYYCFGCKASGNVFRFLMEISDMSFTEAAEELGRRVGVEIPRSKEAVEGRTKRDVLLKVNELAATFFRDKLESGPAGEAARRYLERRGMKRKTVDGFGLGYAPNSWEELTRHLKARGVPMDVVEESGLVASKEGAGHYYDRFRDRIMFPIKDIRGRVIGFGGRVLGDGEPKYLNSPETRLFKKGSTLYTLDVAREAIRKAGFSIIVEGNFDVLFMHQEGFDNSVATLGTALTPDHISTLRRYSEKVTLLFDGDEAGQKAVDRSLELFLGSEIQPGVVILPGGHDPDSFLRDKGKQAMEELLESAKPIVEHVLESRIKKRGEGREERAAALRECAGIVGRISDTALRRMYGEFLAQRLSLPQEVVLARIRAAGRTAKPEGEEEEAQQEAPSFRASELALLRLMLGHEEAVDFVNSHGLVEWFTDPVTARAAVLMINQRKERNAVDLGRLMDELDDPKLAEVLAETAFLTDDPDPEKLDKALRECESGILTEGLRVKGEEITRQIEQARGKGDRDLEIELLKKKMELNTEWNKRRKR